jgi:DNA uptake protein ComE-like DNA-binding protein
MIGTHNKMSQLTLTLLLMVPLSGGCRDIGVDLSRDGYWKPSSLVQGGTWSGVTFTAVEATAALDMANTATQSQLDNEIGLDARAAQNIVDARPITTMVDLDAVAYVGPSALDKLRAHTTTWSQQPGQGSTVIQSGVTFSAQEVTLLLDLVNEASQSVLDDDVGLDSRAAQNIVAARPIKTVADLDAVAYVGSTALNKLKAYLPTWKPGPPEVSVADLEQEAGTKGVSSEYFDKVVVVERAIVTSEPYTTSAGSLIFWVADPAEGDQQQLKVYVKSAADQSTSWVSIFDDVRLEATFTKYGYIFQLKLSDPEQHAISLNKGGLAYEDYLTIQAAWKSTAANPEGVVRLSSTSGTIFMVPMPLFLNHPMWGGSPPAKPENSGNEQDLAWNAAAQQQLNAWHAANP